MTSDQGNQHPFDEYYFQHGCGRPYQRDEEWLTFFRSIAQHISRDLQPESVLDAGCAMGFLVEGLREHGIEAYGVDISEYAIERVHPSVQDYCWAGSITEPFNRQYDLITCIEVLEHMEQSEAEAAVRNLCQFTKEILFSSTPLDFKEATHFNVQPPERWAELFAQEGFFHDVEYDASYITPWAARFVKDDPLLHRLVRRYERKHWLIWKENSDLRELVNEMRVDLSSLEEKSRRVSEENKGLQDVIDGLREQSSKTIDEKEEWRQKFLETQRLAKQLKGELSESEKEASRGRKVNWELNELVNDLRDKNSELEAELLDLYDELEITRHNLNVWAQRWEDLERSASGTVLRALHRLRVMVAPDDSWREQLFRRIMSPKADKKSPNKDLVYSDTSPVQAANQPSKSVKAAHREEKSTFAEASQYQIERRDAISVGLYTTDRWHSASAILRLLGPASMEKSGIEVLRGTDWENDPLIHFPEEMDVVLIQRDFPRHRQRYRQVMDWCEAKSIPVLYEIDDLLSHLPVEHPEYDYYEQAREEMISAMGEADGIIASTLEISEVVRKYNTNVWVLPNYLDDRLWTLASTAPTNSDQLVLGYMGGITKTHLPDLMMIMPVFKRILDKYRDRVLLRFWGLVPPTLQDHKNVEFIKEAYPSYPEFAQFFSRQTCDIFIAPLRENLFNSCKSSIKFLEYSTLGVPGVYSDLPPYRRVVDHGQNGFLAGDLRSWEQNLITLIEDQQLRLRMGEAALTSVRKYYLLSDHAHEWGATYRSALALVK